MSADTDDTSDERMTKIDVRVPATVIEQIDNEYRRRGYTSRSEAIRDALRDWLNPSIELSEAVLADLAESRKQAECGETTSLSDVMDKYGVETDDRDEQ